MRKRRLSRFQQDVSVVIEINKIVNPFSGMLENPDFLPVNTLRLEDGEEIFSHSVIRGSLWSCSSAATLFFSAFMASRIVSRTKLTVC